MFGYLRPYEAELLVKEQELYRAIYCGLCRVMRKKASFFASLSLNYDFVFLAVLRAELTGETFHFCRKRCPVHPLKARSCATTDSEALTYTAMVHLALLYEKLKDDLRDSDTTWKRRLLVRLYLPFIHGSVRKLRKKDARFSEILAHSTKACDALFRLEQQGTKDVDLLAHTWSEGIACACSCDLDGEKKRLMYSASAAAGRLIYLLDALDDMQSDEAKGTFNPFLMKFKSLDTALSHVDEINITLSLYAQELHNVVNLIATVNRYEGLCNNITQKGIPTAVRRAVAKYKSFSRERNVS